jgi:hypothetical protein
MLLSVLTKQEFRLQREEEDRHEEEETTSGVATMR